MGPTGPMGIPSIDSSLYTKLKQNATTRCRLTGSDDSTNFCGPFAGANFVSQSFGSYVNELYLIWGRHRTIFGALDVSYIFPFRNQSASKVTCVVENPGQISHFFTPVQFRGWMVEMSE